MFTSYQYEWLITRIQLTCKFCSNRYEKRSKNFSSWKKCFFFVRLSEWSSKFSNERYSDIRRSGICKWEKKKRLLKLKSWLNLEKSSTWRLRSNSKIQSSFDSKTMTFISIKSLNQIICNRLKRSMSIRSILEMWYDSISHQRNHIWFNEHEILI